MKIPPFVGHVEPPAERCERCGVNDLLGSFANLLYASLGAMIAVIALLYVRPDDRPLRSWRAISVLSGCSGLILSSLDTVVEIGRWGSGALEIGPVSITMDNGMRFVVPLVLTFVSFVLLDLLANAAALYAKRRSGLTKWFAGERPD